MTQRILVMGLPGAGKTTFAKQLKREIELAKKTVSWFNADEVRKQFNDWDFTPVGRMRQSRRMRELADSCDTEYVIADFVAPYKQMRQHYSADWVIWMDTIDEGRFEDTNKAFQPPDEYDFRISEQQAETWAPFVVEYILKNVRRPVFDWKKETVQMLGRWQPWHAGHRALFERALVKTGQVIIQVRDCQGWQGSNPFAIEQVMTNIRRNLDPLYQGMYEIQIVPNIVNITYGRDVGYKIEQEEFTDDITSISATKIRKQMGLE